MGESVADQWTTRPMGAWMAPPRLCNQISSVSTINIDSITVAHDPGNFVQCWPPMSKAITRTSLLGSSSSPLVRISLRRAISFSLLISAMAALQDRSCDSHDGNKMATSCSESLRCVYSRYISVTFSSYCDCLDINTQHRITKQYTVSLFSFRQSFYFLCHTL